MTWLGSRGPDRPARTLGPTVAGRWYPAGESALTQRVDELLASGLPDPERGASAEILAVVAPHAGYDYSGAAVGESRQVNGNATCLRKPFGT